ncbi:TetR/AcrR family transcriptional regulator [Jejubacter calystegiae]|uniref:TetR/AcrR family transcriptional regulator n=1 Tax=Jejubacter calystegiae TaxID=2579935 RepID=A0A4P8YKV5_9ENTR|nr:TetR/AcrR family transcriptional regulator [Jejubacter calystegiae]QCT21421.1 TetR/AcrR family transcriptional regulator [Jejubacter calystegiae]
MGRNREFDVVEALDAALGVFWNKGYEGTSYSDLTRATGVERPALYSAFGNKEALFLRALEHYHSHYLDFFPVALTQPTAKAVAAYMLRAAADLHTRYPEHTGCLGINGALACSDVAKPVQKALIAAREAGEAQLCERFEKAKAEGDLPQTADCAALAAYMCTVLNGMAIQAKAGVGRDKLEAIINQVLAGWPS